MCTVCTKVSNVSSFSSINFCESTKNQNRILGGFSSKHNSFLSSKKLCSFFFVRHQRLNAFVCVLLSLELNNNNETWRIKRSFSRLNESMYSTVVYLTTASWRDVTSFTWSTSLISHSLHIVNIHYLNDFGVFCVVTARSRDVIVAICKRWTEQSWCEIPSSPSCFLQVVEQLLAAGARTDVIDGVRGLTPLFAAIRKSQVDTVNRLIQSGQSVPFNLVPRYFNFQPSPCPKYLLHLTL